MKFAVIVSFLSLVLAVPAADPPSQSTSATMPPGGRLVDIGGRRLHQICSGWGSPAVVVENGAGAFAVDWTRVQADVAKFTTICTYDRAGYAWSDPGPAFDLIEATIDDLHLLLHASEQKAPYVMVGASLGAIYARAYQRRFPEAIGGLVFVDGTHDEAITFMSEGTRTPISQLSAEQLRVAYGQYEKEAPKPSAGSPDQEPLDRLPPEIRTARYWAFEKLVREVGLLPKGLTAAESWRQEFTALRRQRLSSPHPLGGLPLIVLERGNDPNPAWHAQQVELAALSTAGKLLKVEASGHMIHLYQPDAVVNAIQEVVRTVRQ
jgi:pimeloyl-ACP methyl ester carboxylesterase